jgi:hypothetical protein
MGKINTMNNLDTVSFIKTLRLKIRKKAYLWLDQAAIEVNMENAR